jgi:hypothetical protein
MERILYPFLKSVQKNMTIFHIGEYYMGNQKLKIPDVLV